MLRLVKTRNIKSFLPIISDAVAEFGPIVCRTIIEWCAKVDDGKYWEVWLIKKRGQTIGICGLYSPNGRTQELWLGWFCINRKQRGGGLGSAVLNLLEKKAISLKASKLLTYVDSDTKINGRPLTFYKQNGFEYLGRVKSLPKNDRRFKDMEFESKMDHVVMKNLKNASKKTNSRS